MQYWDNVLFPEVLQTIRGERYLLMTDRQIYDELISLAKRAIAKFKFPNIELSYAFFPQDDESLPVRYYFEEDLGFAEINVIIAWMQFYWADFMVSNADNFQNIYFDNNIQSYSPGNVLHNYTVAKERYYNEAHRIESEYYRAGSTPSIGGTIDDD